MNNAIQELKESLIPISELVPGLKKKTANELAGPCPWCGGEDRFVIFQNSGRFLCRGCRPNGGDVIDFYCLNEGIDISSLARKYLSGAEQPREKTKVTGRYDYHDKSGNLLYWKERVEPGRDGKKKEFFFFHGTRDKGRGCEPVLYNLPEVIKAKSVIICEGEKHCDQLKSWGLTATTLDSGSSSKPNQEIIEQLSGKRIAILRDNDSPGLTYALTLAKALNGKCESLKIVLLPGLPDKGYILDWIKQPENDKARLLDIIKNAPEWEPGEDVREMTSEEWPEIVPINGFSAPTIPENILPGWAGDFAREAARTIQVPYPLALASVIGATSLAACSVIRRVNVGPGHDEPLNIYVLAPLLSGERKTGMIGAASTPVYEWEREQSELHSKEIKEARSRRKSQEKIIEAMRNKAARVEDEAERHSLIEEIAREEAALADVPSLPRLLADDVTPEKLAILLENQGEVIGVITSEGGIFDLYAGRYSRDGAPNLDLFLKAHCMEPYRVDRIGRDPIMLKEPRMVACICPQPEVLQSLAGKPGFRGRGVLARFFYFFSESKVGYRDVSPAPIPPRVVEEYSTRIKSLLDMRGANLELTLSPEARTLWVSFAEAVEVEMRPGGEFAFFRDWAGKLPGQAARLAGIFHCIEAKLPGELIVSGETMQRALNLASILADHAKVAFSFMGSDPAMEVARTILQWIQQSPREEFTLRDCLRDLDGKYKNTSEINPGLNVLVERGYLIDKGKVMTGGRPKGPVFLVNPILLGENDELCG